MARLAHRVPALLLPAFLMAAGGAPVLAEGSISFDLAARSLDERTWGPLHNQLSDGLRIEYARPGWPVSLSFGLRDSDAEKTESVFVPDGGVSCFLIFCGPTGNTVRRPVLRSRIRDLTLGVDKAWGGETTTVRAYVGGGVALVRAKLEDFHAGFSDRDRSAGLWARAGIVGMLRPSPGWIYLSYGLEVSAIHGTRLDLGPGRADADYVQVGLISGIGW
jgi:hypothetical protein